MAIGEFSLNRRELVVGGTLSLTAAAITSHLNSAWAQDASPEASGGDEGGGMPPLPEGAVVVADGLWNPGDLAFGDDGTLYIAEGGVEGGDDSADDEPVMATPLPDGSLPQSRPPIVPPQVSMVTSDGTQSVFTTEVGGIGIDVKDGWLYVSTGGGSVGSGYVPQPQENTVTKIDLATGEVYAPANLGQYEVDNNPDGTDINPNLYGLAATSDSLYVCDAGGNTIYKVDPANGSFDLFAVVPNLTDLTGATPTPEEEAQQPGPRQPVPTGVAIDANGNIVVALLSMDWAGPSILTFTPDGNYTLQDVTLQMVVDCTYGPDGLLYVTMLMTTSDFFTNEPAPGAVQRINADGTVENVVDGLFFPQGIAFDGDGNLFVSTNSIISGPDAPLGQVLRFDGIAPA